jgi:hypothetical protein
MPVKSQQRHREYRFEIDAFSPSTIPMARLAEYLSDLATMLGSPGSVHLLKIEKGSTVPIVLVDFEAEPKVRERIKAVKNEEAPEDALTAARNIDRRLLQDNAKADLRDPVGAKVFRFPGRENAVKQEFGPINQAGSFQGIPIKIGGENDPVPLHLEDGKEKHIVLVRRSLAKDIAKHLFGSLLRVEGVGRWVRHRDGEWEMLYFNAASYAIIEDSTLTQDIAALRKLPGEWKTMDDPIAELERIRHGSN